MIDIDNVTILPSDARCPTCNSIIYSRKNKLCGKCGHLLPSEMLFPDEIGNALKENMSLEKRRHKQWLEEKGKRQLDQSNGTFGSVI